MVRQRQAMLLAFGFAIWLVATTLVAASLTSDKLQAMAEGIRSLVLEVSGSVEALSITSAGLSSSSRRDDHEFTPGIR